MTTLEKYKRDYELTKEIVCDLRYTKYIWAAEYIFMFKPCNRIVHIDLITDIIKVCKALLNKDVLIGESLIKYFVSFDTFIWSCQHLCYLDLIKYNESIDMYQFVEPDEHTYLLWNDEDDCDRIVRFSEENLRILIDFIEGED